MINLNKKDIEDIANGYHNTHVQNQDPQELLKTLAGRTVERFEEQDEIQTMVDDLKNMVNKYMSKLDDEDENLLDISCKIEDIADSLEELNYV